MSVPFAGAHRAAAVVAGVHFIAVLATWAVEILEANHSGQAVLVWVPWALVDFPVSLITYDCFGDKPALMHLTVGTMWWYLLVAIAVSAGKAYRARLAPNTSLERTRER
jgi:hypothetical protein